MFKIGDRVVHNSNGICTIEDVGTLNMYSVSKDRIYYTMSPIYNSGTRLFVPVDGNNAVLRHALNKEETMNLLEDLPKLPPLSIQDEKAKEMEYKNALNSSDCRQLIQIIKTLYLRKKERLSDGKKATAVDEKYFHLAEEKLYGEMAVALGIAKDKVEEYIKVYLEGKTVTE